MPTLLAILCFIAAVLLMLNTQLFKSVYLSLEKDVYSMAQNQADYQADSLSSLLNEFANLSVKMVTDGQLSRTAYSRSHFSARRALANYDLSFYKYDDLIIYYPGEEYLLTPDGTCRAEVAFPDVANLSGMMQSLEQLSLPTVFSTLSYGAEMDRAGLVFAYPFNHTSIVLFQLSHGTIQNMLNFDSNGGSQHIIMGRDGTLLFSDRPLDADELQTVVGAPSDAGIPAPLQLGGASYMLINSNLPYSIRMCTLNQVIDQFDELDRVTNLNVTCCVAVVLLGMMVLLISFMHSYMPIAQLAQSAKRLVGASEAQLPDRDIDALRQVFLQYGQLSQQYEQNSQIFALEQMKNMFVLRVINGRYSSNEESNNICRHLGIDFPFPYYCACVILFNGKSALQENTPDGIVRDTFSVYFCQTENRSSALGIINCARTDQLMEIGEAIMRHLSECGDDAMPTVAIGHPCEALQHIPVSYIEARTAMDYRLVFGLHTVILYDMTELRQAESAVYPRKELNAFAMGLLNWDVDEIQTQLDALVAQIRAGGLSLQQVKCVCMELSTSFMREVSNVNKSKTVKMEHFDVFHICEYDSIDELARHIAELSASIKRYLESSEVLCRDNDIHRCLTLMNGNLENSQFSLESLCDHFSITPQTLRRRFKKATGMTMNDYLTALRLDRAKQLLTTTNLDLADICRQCGYADQSSFIRAFKAKEGETPGKYREFNQNIG